MAPTADEGWAVLREVVRVRNLLYEVRRLSASLGVGASLDPLLADADARLAWVTRRLAGDGEG